MSIDKIMEYCSNELFTRECIHFLLSSVEKKGINEQHGVSLYTSEKCKICIHHLYNSAEKRLLVILSEVRGSVKAAEAGNSAEGAKRTEIQSGSLYQTCKSQQIQGVDDDEARRRYYASQSGAGSLKGRRKIV